MRKLLHSLMALILCAPLTGCGSKTTFDRVGAGAVVAAEAYLIQIDQLHAAGLLSDANHTKLKAKGEAAKRSAERFRDRLAKFPEIEPRDVGRLTLEIAALLGEFRGVLTDSELAGLRTESLPIRILNFAIASLTTASIVLSSIHPPESPTTASRGIVPRKKASEIVVNLPKTEKDVEEALLKAGK
jgi:hypothetical protein